jgi:hypothetical protein
MTETLKGRRFQTPLWETIFINHSFVSFKWKDSRCGYKIDIFNKAVVKSLLVDTLLNY